MRSDDAGGEQIRHRIEFESWIRSRGVGSGNRTGDSIASYVAYLKRASRELRTEIGPRTVRNRADADAIASRLRKIGVNEGTAAKCRTALRHYADMVEAKKLN